MKPQTWREVNFSFVIKYMWYTLQCILIKFYLTHASVEDFLEVNCNSTGGDVLVVLAVVDQYAHLLGANLVGTVTKHKQHRVDDIGLATAVGTDDGSKTLQSKTKSLWLTVESLMTDHLQIKTEKKQWHLYFVSIIAIHVWEVCGEKKVGSQHQQWRT